MMRVNMDTNTKADNFTVVIIFVMFISLFFSRALLTSSTWVIILVPLIAGSTSFFKSYFSNRLNILVGLLFLIPLISGFWSTDISEWRDHSLTKLPLALLPLAFSSIQIKLRHFVILSWLYILLILLGVLLSSGYYLTNLSSVHDGYLRSKLMVVPFYNDHVIFSWGVVIAIILILATRPYLTVFKYDKNLRTVSWIILASLVLFLHLLAARTGLLCFYMGAIVLIIWHFKKVSRIKLILLSLALLSIPILAYYLLPTFHNRVLYAMYDWQHYSRANYTPGFSDVSRILSLKGGLSIFMNNIWYGVGFGDIAHAMQSWYTLHFNYLPPEDRLLPHNEWLVYGCGAGIFAAFLLTAVVLYPFVAKDLKRKPYLLCFMTTVITCFLTDVTLEMQTGVFLFGFFIMWFQVDYPPLEPLN